MYSKFTSMAQPGDIVYIARYLVSGAEASSLYLEVTAVEGTEVICTAQNAATLEGLLCVFHAERSRGDGLNNVQVSVARSGRRLITSTCSLIMLIS